MTSAETSPRAAQNFSIIALGLIANAHDGCYELKEVTDNLLRVDGHSDRSGEFLRERDGGRIPIGGKAMMRLVDYDPMGPAGFDAKLR